MRRGPRGLGAATCTSAPSPRGSWGSRDALRTPRPPRPQAGAPLEPESGGHKRHPGAPSATPRTGPGYGLPGSRGGRPPTQWYPGQLQTQAAEGCPSGGFLPLPGTIACTAAGGSSPTCTSKSPPSVTGAPTVGAPRARGGHPGHLEQIEGRQHSNGHRPGQAAQPGHAPCPQALPSTSAPVTYRCTFLLSARNRSLQPASILGAGARRAQAGARVPRRVCRPLPPKSHRAPDQPGQAMGHLHPDSRRHSHRFPGAETLVRKYDVRPIINPSESGKRGSGVLCFP